MITVVVGKRRNTTPWFSAVGEKNERTATANCTTRDRKPHEPQPQIARTATARTASAKRTNRDRTAVLINLFLGSTVYKIIITM
jgi:hypothetical protein